MASLRTAKLTMAGAGFGLEELKLVEDNAMACQQPAGSTYQQMGAPRHDQQYEKRSRRLTGPVMVVATLTGTGPLNFGIQYEGSPFETLRKVFNTPRKIVLNSVQLTSA
jgi:hypothetical protein